MRRLRGLRTFGREVVCLLVPGVSFCLAGWPRLGLCILAGWVAALALYAVGVGLPTANWAFMLLITAHAASVARHFQPWLVQKPLRTRMATGTLLFLAVSLLVYAPARQWFERHVATPLPVGTSTLLVDPRVHPASIQRGDWLAYRIEGSYAHGVQVRRGYGFGPVLAMPGDRVAFGERTFASTARLACASLTCRAPANWWCQQDTGLSGRIWMSARTASTGTRQPRPRWVSPCLSGMTWWANRTNTGSSER